MYLADEFYLIAHEDATGQPRLHAKAGGFGVAAALLAELYLHGGLTVDAGGVKPLPAATPDDPLAHKVSQHVLGEPRQHAVRDWLAFLGRTAVADVAGRLTAAGVLEVVETRRLFGVSRAHVPVAVAVNDAAWPHARITSRLTRRAPLEPKDQILAGLSFATGLTREMLWDDATQASHVYLAQIIGGLPAPIRTLVTETEIAISKTAANRG